MEKLQDVFGAENRSSPDISRLNYNTIHVDGTRNQVADSLSHYYEYDTIEDEYPNSKSVKADEILDLDRDLAPIQKYEIMQLQDHKD